MWCGLTRERKDKNRKEQKGVAVSVAACPEIVFESAEDPEIVFESDELCHPAEFDPLF